VKAIRNRFREAERLYLEYAEKQEEELGEIDRSCAIVIIIIDDICYVANVGDSRAVMSVDGGQKIFVLSNDHIADRPYRDEKNKRKRRKDILKLECYPCLEHSPGV
jgi:serine/threonine protein phosphatase PrpC